MVGYQTGDLLYVSGHIPMTPEGVLLTGTVRRPFWYFPAVDGDTACAEQTMRNSRVPFFQSCIYAALRSGNVLYQLDTK